MLNETINAHYGSAVFPQLTFVDRKNFNNLQSKYLSLKDLVPMMSSFTKPSDKLSIVTQSYLKYLNNRIYSGLFGIEGVCNPHHTTSLSKTEDGYIVDKYRNDMLTPQDEGKTYYEILPVTDKDFLVVMESGFIHHLTATKDNCLAFVLACLRCIDCFNCDKSQLNRLYLNLLFNDGFTELLRVRLD